MGDYLSDLVIKNTGTADTIQPRLAARFEPAGAPESGVETTQPYREQTSEAVPRERLSSELEAKPEENDEIRAERKSPDETVRHRPPFFLEEETPRSEATATIQIHQAEKLAGPSKLPEAGRTEEIAGETISRAGQSGKAEATAREEFQASSSRENPDEKIQQAVNSPPSELLLKTKQAGPAETGPGQASSQRIIDIEDTRSNESVIETTVPAPARETGPGKKHEAAAGPQTLGDEATPGSLTILPAPGTQKAPGAPQAFGTQEGPGRGADTAPAGIFRTAGEPKILEEESFARGAEPDAEKQPAAAVKPRVVITKRRAEETVFDRSGNSFPRGRAVGQTSNGAEIPEAPTINVTIGRVEVRAVSPAAPPPKETRAGAKPLSLDEYLRKRRAGGEK